MGRTILTTVDPKTPPAAGASRALVRSLNLPLAVLFGLDVTIGAGIYVLIGATAGRAGCMPTNIRPKALVALIGGAVTSAFAAVALSAASAGARIALLPPPGAAPSLAPGDAYPESRAQSASWLDGC